MNSSATLGSATSTAKAGTDASMCSQNIWDRRPARENRKETRWPALSPGQPLRRKRMSSFRGWKCATCASAAGQLASRLWDGTCTRRFSSSLRRRKMRKAICMIAVGAIAVGMFAGRAGSQSQTASGFDRQTRSEEHTSELQSRGHLVCRLLLEKKKKRDTDHTSTT